MTTVGVRELKNRLSEYLDRVQSGERLVVSERGRPVAVILPAGIDPRLEELLRDRVVRWDGGKPRGSSRAPKIKGPTVTQAVIEGRR